MFFFHPYHNGNKGSRKNCEKKYISIHETSKRDRKMKKKIIRRLSQKKNQKRIHKRHKMLLRRLRYSTTKRSFTTATVTIFFFFYNHPHSASEKNARKRKFFGEFFIYCWRLCCCCYCGCFVHDLLLKENSFVIFFSSKNLFSLFLQFIFLLLHSWLRFSDIFLILLFFFSSGSSHFFFASIHFIPLFS